MQFKKAFTLIELLVVIAIIAILAAILFPVFAQAKLAAKKAVAVSNTKQIGLSHMLYVNDYDDTCPKLGGSTGDGTRLDYTWQLLPYTKSTDLFLDPLRNDIDTGCNVKNSDEPNCRLVGYGYNWGPIMRRGGGLLLRQIADPNAGTGLAGGNYIPGINMSMITTPASMFAYGESYDTPRITMTGTFLLCTFTGSTNSSLRYGGSWPTVYADGHAKAITWRAGAGDSAAENNEFAFPANLNDAVNYCYDPSFVLSATTWNGSADGDSLAPDGTTCSQLPAILAALPTGGTPSSSTPTWLP